MGFCPVEKWVGGQWAPAARDGLGMVRALCGRKEESFWSANRKNEKLGRETTPGQPCDDTTGKKNRTNHLLTVTTTMQPRTRPIQRVAAAASQCTTEVCHFWGAVVDDNWTQLTDQATVYGKCIVSDYNSVHKDKCAVEFMKLKNCYLVS